MYSPPNRARIRALPSRASAALLSPSSLGIASFLLLAAAVYWPVVARGQTASLEAPDAAAAATVRSSGFELQISIVGFAIDDAELETLEIR